MSAAIGLVHCNQSGALLDGHTSITLGAWKSSALISLEVVLQCASSSQINHSNETTVFEIEAHDVDVPNWSFNLGILCDDNVFTLREHNGSTVTVTGAVPTDIDSKPNLGKWNHVIIVATLSSREVYVNGHITARRHSDSMAPLQGMNQLTIGRSEHGFHGTIATASLWLRSTLSAVEISERYRTWTQKVDGKAMGSDEPTTVDDRDMRIAVLMAGQSSRWREITEGSDHIPRLKPSTLCTAEGMHNQAHISDSQRSGIFENLEVGAIHNHAHSAADSRVDS